jgi:hypothetical protein
MKIIWATAVALLLSPIAFAQSIGVSEGVPRMLAERGVTSATTFAAEYQKFQKAVAATYTASDALKQEILLAKRAPDADRIARLGAAAIKFSDTRFDLNYEHYQAGMALSALVDELIARQCDNPTFLVQEDTAVDSYLGDTAEKMEQDFAAADKRWRKTAHRAEKIVYSRRWRQRSTD